MRLNRLVLVAVVCDALNDHRFAYAARKSVTKKNLKDAVTLCLAKSQSCKDWELDITDLSALFYDTTDFNADLSGWSVSKVTNMESMFGAAPVFNGAIGTWDTSNVIDVGYMFWSATNFNSDITEWDTSSFRNMIGMFTNTELFNQNLHRWDVSSVTNMYGLFWNAQAFNGALNNWNVEKVLNMGSIFYNAISLNRPINGWTLVSAIEVTEAFSQAAAFNRDINWDISAVSSLKGFFYKAKKFSGDISSWDTSNVKDLLSCFEEAYQFNNDISSWDTSNVKNLSYSFYYANGFNQNIGSWDTTKVTGMEEVFTGADKFNQSLSSWSMAQVNAAQNMFHGARAFNGDLSQWDTSGIGSFHEMFMGAKQFNNKINGWDTSNARVMTRMFAGAWSFNSNLSSWNMEQVTNMEGMFLDARGFNKNISSWQVSSAKSMRSMFRNANAFNHDLTSWQASLNSIKDLAHMFDEAGGFRQRLCWTIGNDVKTESMFAESYGSISCCKDQKEFSASIADPDKKGHILSISSCLSLKTFGAQRWNLCGKYRTFKGEYNSVGSFCPETCEAHCPREKVFPASNLLCNNNKNFNMQIGRLSREVNCENLGDITTFKRICDNNVSYNGRQVKVAHLCKGVCNPACRKRAAVAANRAAARQRKMEKKREQAAIKRAKLVFKNLLRNCKDHPEFSFKEENGGVDLKCTSVKANYLTLCNVKRKFNGIQGMIKDWCPRSCNRSSTCASNIDNKYYESMRKTKKPKARLL
mmetsp:Transcript_5507/g.11424  ORF Transcript_5507/g.11424 Transcript_5507/m.11424 type:complete len:753 (-) Transcript_5507:232-2490(-)